MYEVMYNRIQQEHIKKRVELTVCNIVNSAYNVISEKHADVTPLLLYENVKKCPAPVSVARQFVFVVLHDRFGFSYRQMSALTCMRETSIMRCVRKVRTLIFIDSVYNTINQLLMNALKGGLL